MGVEGIGASVVRKEDRRFTTGKGRYVDDIKLQGMTHAHSLSPSESARVRRGSGRNFVKCRIREKAAAAYSAACETFMRDAASSTDLTMLW